MIRKTIIDDQICIVLLPTGGILNPGDPALHIPLTVICNISVD